MRRHSQAFRALLGVLLAVAPVVVGCASSSLELGIRAYEDGALTRARADFERATDEHPEDPEAWWWLGVASARAARYPEARDAFARAQALRPRDPAPRIRIGMLWELERNYDEAERSYRAAIEIAPARAWPRKVLGARLLRWGRAPEAVPVVEGAVALDKGDAELAQLLGHCRHAAGDDEGALVAFAAGAKRHPEDRGLALGEAAVLVRLARYREALDVYDRVARRWPEDAAVHVGRGLVLDALGDVPGALAAFERAAEVAGEPAPYAARVQQYRVLRGLAGHGGRD